MSFFTGKNTKEMHSGTMLLARQIIGVIWFVAPLLIFVFSSAFPSGPEDGKCVSWRPDPSVYIVAWIFIVLCLMAAWLVISRNCTGNLAWIVQTILFFLVILLAIIWMWRYHVDKRDGIAVFVFLLMLLLFLLPLANNTSTWAAALLMPLFFWAVFQLGINCAELACVPEEVVVKPS
jgi:tryptophan-rich sensory protein